MPACARVCRENPAKFEFLQINAGESFHYRFVVDNNILPTCLKQTYRYFTKTPFILIILIILINLLLDNLLWTMASPKQKGKLQFDESQCQSQEPKPKVIVSPTELRKIIRSFDDTLRGGAKAPARVKAVNTLLNGGHDLSILSDDDIASIWESLFFALWYAEMGRGCEEIIAAIERACNNHYRLTKYGFRIIAKKWYGLDQYRIDKISHLARHLFPVILEKQISLWFKNLKAKKRLSSRDVPCKQILKRTLDDIKNSYGLCYFILEILAEETNRTLARVYEKRNILTGKFELRANLIVFLYKQVVRFAASSDLDVRLLRTFDQYVIKRFIVDILPNESQLTQILISLRLHQALDKHINKTKNSLSSKCKALFERWSEIIQDIHENCINGEYFPQSRLPLKGTICLKPVIKSPKLHGVH